MTQRVLIVAAIAVVVAGAAAYALMPARGVPQGAPTEDEMAREVGAAVMLHVQRGHVAGRSGELMLVPRPNNYIIGEWDLTTLGTATPTMSTSHPNPWSYLTRVPIIIYGDGYAPRGLSVEDPEADIADIVPTYARLIGMDDFSGRDGEPLDEVTGRRPPKLIVTIVIDGGGWNVLMEHPDQWPTIARLRAGGTTYVNATIGSAPSITGALHATFGTGDYPLHHGIPGNQMRAPDGQNVDTYQDNADPTFLNVPTLGDLWDQENANEPLVGTVSYEGWHLGMIGHGAQMEGGDKDIAVLWEADENAWWVNEEYYELPEYLQTTDLAKLESYERALDHRDGMPEGTWFGHTLEQLQEKVVRPGTPAFTRFTGDAVMEVLRNEPWGRDRLTDMFWIEMKMPDYAGHAWNMINPEEGDVLFETDRQIGRVLEFLDRRVGPGGYVLAISADHGQQPLAEATGGWRINSKELERDIESRFGGDVVEKITPVDIYFDVDALADEGHSLDDVARFIGTYTLGNNVPEAAPGSDRVPPARLDEKLFAAAFSTDYLQDLTEQKISSFGDGIYPEGGFTVDASGG